MKKSQDVIINNTNFFPNYVYYGFILLIYKMNKEDPTLLYVNLMATFYEKIISKHPKKMELSTKLKNFKTQYTRTNQFKKQNFMNDDVITIKSSKTDYLSEIKTTSSSPQRQLFVKRLESLLPQYKIFTFAQENTFYRLLGYSYIIEIFNKCDIGTIEMLKEQTKRYSQNEQFDFESRLFRKFHLIMDYIQRVIRINTVNSQTRLRLESLFVEDKSMLGKFIQAILTKRKPSISKFTVDQNNVRNQFLDQVSDILGMRLTLVKIIEENVSRLQFGTGNLNIIFGYDKKSGNYFNLTLKNSSSTEIQKQRLAILQNLMMTLDNNSNNLYSMKEYSRMRNKEKDTLIKQRLKKEARLNRK